MTTGKQEGDWIPWSGGAKPEGLRDFEVRFRDGDLRRYRKGKSLPMDRCWLHASHEGRSDIIAYRVVKQP